MSLKTLTSLVLLLQVTTFTMGQQEEDCEQSWGPLSTTLFDDALALMGYYSRCSFPTYKLNVSCILSSCPLLKGVCPLKSTSALNTTLSILTSCLGQKGLICGLNMSRIPVVELAWTTAQLVPATLASGNLMLNPGTGFTNNLSMAKFKVNQTANPNGTITLTIEDNDISSYAECSCNFSIPSTSVLSTLRPFGPLTSALTSPFSFLNIPSMHAIMDLNLTATVSIDLKAQPPTIKTLDDHYDVQSSYSNFTTPSGVQLLQPVVKLFNEAMARFIKESVITSTVTTFLATLAALALKGAQEGCP